LYPHERSHVGMVNEDADTKPLRGLSAPWRLLSFVCYLGSMLDSRLGESAAKEDCNETF
jgi:hypothetical protein